MTQSPSTEMRVHLLELFLVVVFKVDGLDSFSQRDASKEGINLGSFSESFQSLCVSGSFYLDTQPCDKHRQNNMTPPMTLLVTSLV